MMTSWNHFDNLSRHPSNSSPTIDDHYYHHHEHDNDSYWYRNEDDSSSSEYSYDGGNGDNFTSTNSPDIISVNNIGIAVLLCIFCTATVFGNALVILAVFRERYLHSVTNYFITSLALADCLVGLLVMPFSAIFEAMGKTWIFGSTWCDIWRSLDVLASTASILNLCVISLDRYWAIRDPFTYPSIMTNTRACVLIALVCICSSLISFPAILWWRAVREKPIADLKCPFTNDLGYLVCSSIISFYAPLLVMVFTYYRIYRAAVKQTKSLKLGTKLCTDGDIELTLRIHRGGAAAATSYVPPPPPETLQRTHSSNHHHALRHPQHSDPSCDDNEIGHISLLNQVPNDNNMPRNNSIRTAPKNVKNFSISRKLAKFAKEKKAAKTLGIVMGVFIVCWLPFFVTNLISGFCASCLSQVELVQDIVTWLGWINSGMNPVIYCFWSRDFRRAFARIVCVCCPGRIRRRQYHPGYLRPRLARLTQVNGHTAESKIPWAVSIADEKDHFCGGSIINQNYVLTATYCITNRTADRMQVRVGFNKLNDRKLTKKTYDVEKIIRKDGEKTLLLGGKGQNADIAILKLAKPIKLKRGKIEPACLNFEKINYTHELMACGWGGSKYIYQNRRDHLDIYYPKMSMNLKLAYFNESDFLYIGGCNTNNSICIDSNKGDSICYGDIGSALHYDHNGKTAVEGVAAHLYFDEESPYHLIYCRGKAGYARMSYYKNWIEGIIGDDYCHL